MPTTVTSRGTAIYKFGAYTCAGYLVADANITKSGEEFILDDETGQNVTHFTNFGLKNSVTVNFVPLSGTTEPAIDAVLTYNGITAAVTRVEKVSVKRQPEMWRLTLSAIPGVTYT